MLRKHLDFVASMQFASRTGDRELDRDIEQWVKEKGRASNWDVAGRHNRDRWLRLSEAGRMLRGDELIVRHRSGRVQNIRGTRVRNPRKWDTAAAIGGDSDEWTHGLRLSKAGRTLAYSICTDDAARTLQRVVPAYNADLLAFWSAADGQVRGISPIVTAANDFRDLATNQTLQIAQSRIHAMLAIAHKREAGKLKTDFGSTTPQAATTEEAKPIDLRSDGPTVVQLSENESLDLLSAGQPTNGYRDFHELILMIALKAFDLPYSFFDESHTNFVGQLAALQLYRLSCIAKQADLIELLDNLTRWQMRIAIASGELAIPNRYTVATLPIEWRANGVPWWDLSKQMRGEALAIENGLKSPQQVHAEHGTDFYDVIDQIAEADKYAMENGIYLPYGVEARKSRIEKAAKRNGQSTEVAA